MRSDLADAATGSPAIWWERMDAHRQGEGKARVSWMERRVCYHAALDMLAEQRTPKPTGRKWTQAETRPVGLARIARHSHVQALPNHSKNHLYHLFGEGISDPLRLSSMPNLRPAAALVVETKAYTFAFYRMEVLRLGQVAENAVAAYFRALGAWASDHPALAACGQQLPLWVPEDVSRFVAQSANCTTEEVRTQTVERLVEAARTVVERVLDDASLTALGAFNAVRPVVVSLFRDENSRSRALLNLSRLLAEMVEDVQFSEESVPQDVMQNMLALAGDFTRSVGRLPLDAQDDFQGQ